MLKPVDLVKLLEVRAGDALREVLAQVPIVKVVRFEAKALAHDNATDILAHLVVAKRPHVLVCDVTLNGQPRHVRAALLQLRHRLDQAGTSATAVLIAPYLSPAARAMCREKSVGYLDFEGNAWIAFGGVFIERSLSDKPVAARREFRSLFKPKSAQVLSTLLREPGRAWRVTELAASARVSLGHVSNVRAALLDREWAAASGDGLVLSKPDALLDAWRDAYAPTQGERLAFYSPLHGSAFENAARSALGADEGAGRAAFASFSAAHWLAPYGRTGTQYFYADSEGLVRLRAALKLAPVAQGENIVIDIPKDDGVFLDLVEPAPGAFCTSPARTYLDLCSAGERGQEAAEHLRQEKLAWIP